MNPKTTTTFQRTMNSPVIKRLRSLEQNRSARRRQVRQRVVQTIKHTDEAAKGLLLQDLTDVTAAVIDVLQEWKDTKNDDEATEDV